MEWSDVRIFLAVARQGSLGGGARVLGVSHPTVARRVRALERDVGLALFQRHKDGVLLTDAGHQVLLVAGDMESAALALERRLASKATTPGGPLRISAPDWFATYVLPPVIGALRRDYPAVVPELMVSSRLYDLSRREADIVFRVVPFEEPNVVQSHLMQVVYGVYGDARHAIGPLDTIAGLSVVEMDTSLHDYPESAWLRTMFPQIRTAAVTNHRALQAALCRRGEGLAVLPSSIGDVTEGLIRIPMDNGPPPRDVWMGYHEDLRSQPAVRALADLARRELGTRG